MDDGYQLVMFGYQNPVRLSLARTQVEGVLAMSNTT